MKQALVLIVLGAIYIRFTDPRWYPHQYRRKLLSFARDNTLVGKWIDEYDKQHDAGLVSRKKDKILSA